jgi:hypothetical protein
MSSISFKRHAWGLALLGVGAVAVGRANLVMSCGELRLMSVSGVIGPRLGSGPPRSKDAVPS